MESEERGRGRKEGCDGDGDGDGDAGEVSKLISLLVSATLGARLFTPPRIRQ